MAVFAPVLTDTLDSLFAKQPTGLFPGHFLYGYKVTSPDLSTPVNVNVPLHWWMGSLITYTQESNIVVNWYIVNEYTTGQVTRLLQDCLITKRDYLGQHRRNDVFVFPYPELLQFCMLLATHLQFPIPLSIKPEDYNHKSTSFNCELLLFTFLNAAQANPRTPPS